MGRPATDADIRRIFWILGIAAVAAFLFYLWLSRSIERDVAEATRPVETKASEGQAWADAVHARYQSAITGFAAAVREGRLADAYAATATGYRSTVPLERFGAAVRGSAWLATFSGVVVRRTREMGGTARVEGVLESGAGNVDLVAHFTDEAGAWRLTGLVLGGSPALPGP